MAVLLIECTNEQQQSVIRFMWSEGVKTWNLRTMSATILCARGQFTNGWKRFKGGPTSVRDTNSERS